MNERKVTDQNLHLILPGKVCKMAALYAADFNLSVTEALNRIYTSSTYRMLEKEGSKLWHYGPVALYEMFLENH